MISRALRVMGMATACYRSITWRTMDKTPMRTGPRNAPLREPFHKWVYYVLFNADEQNQGDDEISLFISCS